MWWVEKNGRRVMWAGVKEGSVVCFAARVSNASP